jgi:hypothetical protein
MREVRRKSSLPQKMKIGYRLDDFVAYSRETQKPSYFGDV